MDKDGGRLRYGGIFPQTIVLILLWAIWCGLESRTNWSCRAWDWGLELGGMTLCCFPASYTLKSYTPDHSSCDYPLVGLCSYYSVNLSSAGPQITSSHYNDEEKNWFPAWAMVSVEFSCSPHVCMGFFLVLSFLLHTKDMHVRWTDPVWLSECVCEWRWKDILSRVGSHLHLQP